ncbi:MAG: IPExxxVDY family protein [Flavobacteriaceae bacterium]|nr:IPExxxVDY family protein [Flavobacteriaceae bacterium]
MQIHSLELEDFSDSNYTLIGIHAVLEEFKLAYVLNETLNTKFVRADYNLDFENKNNNASFSIYEFRNKKFSHDWFLISNTYIDETVNEPQGFFTSNQIKTYLISEKKNIDYFLKLEGGFQEQYVLEIIEKIKSVHQVITAYLVDHHTLKSKDFLIF